MKFLSQSPACDLCVKSFDCLFVLWFSIVKQKGQGIILPNLTKDDTYSVLTRSYGMSTGGDPKGAVTSKTLNVKSGRDNTP
jgi:hypothetical protein